MPKDIITFKQESEQFTDMMVTESFKLIEGHVGQRGSKVSRSVSTMFIAKLIGRMVYRALTDKQEGSKDDQYRKAKESFADMKVRLTDCVAAGFQAAMSKFAGRQVEYYCQIRTVPEPVNKEPI